MTGSIFYISAFLSIPMYADATGESMTATMNRILILQRSRAEIMKHLELANTNHFRKTYLKLLLESGKLKMTIPDKPNSRLQKYIKA